MKKKWILSISSAVLAFGLLVGCSGEGEVPESNEGMNEDIDLQAPSSSDVPVAPDNNTDSLSEPSEPIEEPIETPIEEPTDETEDEDEDMLNEEPTDENESEKDSN